MAKKALYHSFYADRGMTHLKHALLYFGSIVILDESLLAISDDNRLSRWVQLIPDHVRDDLESLRGRGLVEVKPPDSTSDYIKFFHAIARARSGSLGRVYAESDIYPLFDSLQLDPDNRSDVRFANEIAVLIAAMQLKNLAVNEWVPCLDSRLIFDETAIGLTGLFAALGENGSLLEEEMRQIKAQVLARKVFSVYLPAFNLHSFDDVLEIRDRLKGVAPLSAALLELSKEVESLPWERGFDQEVASVIDRSVRPVVEELVRESRFSFSGVAKKMARTTCVLTLQGILPEMVDKMLLGLSGATLYDAIKGERGRMRQVRLESSFSMLLEIKELK